MNRFLLAILVSCNCRAQTMPPTPAQIIGGLGNVRGDSSRDPYFQLTGRPNGGFMTFPEERPREVPPTGQTVSVGQLQHRISKESERGFQHATKLARAGERGKAAAELEIVVERDPEFLRAEIQLGIEYAFLRRWDDAETVLRRSLQMEPTSASAHYILALILYCKGDMPGAEQSTRRALLFASQNPLAHMFLGELLLRRAETHEEGITELKFAARTIPDARRLLRDLGSR